MPRILPSVKSIGNEPWAPPHSILILRLSALGDVLHCLPALEALHELWPDAEIDWIAESLGASIIDGHPLLRRVHRLPRKEWRRELRRASRWDDLRCDVSRFFGALRRRRYDLIIDFQGNLRSTVVAECVRHRRRVTHHPSEVKEHAWLMRASAPRAPAGRVHRVQKNLHLVRALGWHGSDPPARLPDFTEERARIAAELADLTSEAPIVLHPLVSPFGRFKEWPREYYAELAREIAACGTLLISWGPGERDAAEEIAAAADGAATPAPETRSPRELAALLASARLVIGGDTGPLHLAAAAGVPVLSLFGPKDPALYAPWSPGGGTNRFIRSPAPCSPCVLRRCDHAVCMRMIHPREVAETARGMLAVAAI